MLNIHDFREIFFCGRNYPCFFLACELTWGAISPAFSGKQTGRMTVAAEGTGGFLALQPAGCGCLQDKDFGEMLRVRGSRGESLKGVGYVCVSKAGGEGPKLPLSRIFYDFGRVFSKVS